MRARHFIQLIGLSALWGGSFPLTRIAAPVLTPFGLAGLRCLLAAMVLAALMRLLRHRWPARSAWPGLAAISLLTVIPPFTLFSYATLTLPAGYAAVLNSTSPLFGVLMAAALREERLTLTKLAGCLMGFTGVALLVQLGPVRVTPAVVLAALACMLASAAYGVGTIFMRRATLKYQPLPASAAIHVSASAILLAPMSSVVPVMQPTWGAVAAVLVLGCVTSGIMYWLSMRLMREISATASTSAAFMIPLFGVGWGALFLGEPVTSGMAIGCLLILIASAMITGFNPFRSSPPEA